MSSIVLYPEADVIVIQSSPTVNYNSTQKIAVGGGSYGTYRTWMRFDLSSIPAGSTINSGILELQNFYEERAGGGAYPGDYIIDVARSTDITWNKTTITWNNAPNGTVGAVGASFTVNGGGDNVFLTYGYIADFDIASDVSDAFGTGKLSLRIKLNDEVSFDVIDWFQDKDYSLTTYSRLTVGYTPPASNNTNMLLLF